MIIPCRYKDLNPSANRSDKRIPLGVRASQALKGVVHSDDLVITGLAERLCHPSKQSLIGVHRVPHSVNNNAVIVTLKLCANNVRDVSPVAVLCLLNARLIHHEVIVPGLAQLHSSIAQLLDEASVHDCDPGHWGCRAHVCWADWVDLLGQPQLTKK